MIVSASTSQALGGELADALGVDHAAAAFRAFPDGEVLAAAPGVDADRVAVVAATTTPRAHIEALQLQDAARAAGADAVATVLPYMGYARQDRPVAPGSSGGDSPPGYPHSARAVARALSPATDRVVLVSPHEDDHVDLFDAPATAVSAAPALADALPADLADPAFLAPDDGARAIARSVRDAYGAGTVDHFEKTRLSGSEVELRPRDVDVAGRDAVVVDDIVATGSTAAETVEVLHDRGADRVYAAVVHPVLAGGALTRLRRAGVERVLATDTVERPVSAVSAAPAVADALADWF